MVRIRRIVMTPIRSSTLVSKHCDGGIDNDCDGKIDNDDPSNAGDATWYYDGMATGMVISL